MFPARTNCPTARFMPRYLGGESRPLVLDPPAFFDANRRPSAAARDDGDPTDRDAGAPSDGETAASAPTRSSSSAADLEIDYKTPPIMPHQFFFTLPLYFPYFHIFLSPSHSFIFV